MYKFNNIDKERTLQQVFHYPPTRVLLINGAPYFLDTRNGNAVSNLHLKRIAGITVSNPKCISPEIRIIRLPCGKYFILLSVSAHVKIIV